mgnify:CR=1 FL=1
MSMQGLKDYKELKAQGLRLGRAGLAERVLVLVDEFNENRTYKNAIALAGKLRAVAAACKYDSYWDEKMSSGFEREKNDISICDITGKLPEARKSWWPT